MTEREWRERGLRDAVLAGDVGAWRAWYEAEYAPLEKYVLWRSGGLRDLADDVVQDAWLTAVRRIGRFDPAQGPFQRWLGGIAANVLRNHLRARSRRRQREQPMNGELPATNPAHLHGDRGERVAVVLDALPARFENALRMKYLEQMSVAAMANATGETEKAIESLLTRARAAFREAFGDE